MSQLPVRRAASLQRVDPMREFDDLRARMDRLMEDALGASYPDSAIWAPPVDIEETDDAWLVEVDLPAVRREDLTVELNDGELAIHGEVREKQRVGILRRRTRRTGRFDYRVGLPTDLDPDAVEATLSEGVLHVRLPKPARSQPRRIEVKG
jgi:HSP20 family protein